MDEVVLTPHARQRCAQMEISTKRVKHALRDEFVRMTWPGKQGKDLFVRVPSEPDLAFIVSARDRNRVITVLWWSPDKALTRDDPKPFIDTTKKKDRNA